MKNIRVLAVLLMLPELLFAPVAAQETSSRYPDVPKSTGKPHPEGNAFWRVNHMKLLLHDRDRTMRLGDREIQASLKECVTCHAVNGPDGQPVSYENEKYFCRVCHEFTAVKIDCFTCHRSTPDSVDAQTLMNSGAAPDLPRLAAYIDRLGTTAQRTTQ